MQSRLFFSPYLRKQIDFKERNKKYFLPKSFSVEVIEIAY